MERKIADLRAWRSRRGFVRANEVSGETKLPFRAGPSEIETLVERIVEIATGWRHRDTATPAEGVAAKARTTVSGSWRGAER